MASLGFAWRWLRSLVSVLRGAEVADVFEGGESDGAASHRRAYKPPDVLYFGRRKVGVEPEASDGATSERPLK